MLVWMSRLLDVSRAFYTEKQREYFFRLVDEIYRHCCIESVREVFPGSAGDEIKKMLCEGRTVEDWWDKYAGPEADMDSFLYDRVYKAVFDDLQVNIEDYVEEVCTSAPEEYPEEWYKCSFIKSLLHEFINDRKDPYKISVRLSDKETAFLAYALCWILTIHFRNVFDMKDQDAEYMLKILYCGEFAQNDWLNMFYHENVQTIRRKVTEQFLYAFLSGKYNPGMDGASFAEFIHDEMLAPVYMTLYDAREEILEKSREYWAGHAQPCFEPDEMENFCQYITCHVHMIIPEPRMEWYLQDAFGEEDLTEDPEEDPSCRDE